MKKTIIAFKIEFDPKTKQLTLESECDDRTNIHVYSDSSEYQLEQVVRAMNIAGSSILSLQNLVMCNKSDWKVDNDTN